MMVRDSNLYPCLLMCRQGLQIQGRGHVRRWFNLAHASTVCGVALDGVDVAGSLVNVVVGLLSVVARQAG